MKFYRGLEGLEKINLQGAERGQRVKFYRWLEGLEKKLIYRGLRGVRK